MGGLRTGGGDGRCVVCVVVSIVGLRQMWRVEYLGTEREKEERIQGMGKLVGFRKRKFKTTRRTQTSSRRSTRRKRMERRNKSLEDEGGLALDGFHSALPVADAYGALRLQPCTSKVLYFTRTL